MTDPVKLTLDAPLEIEGRSGLDQDEVVLEVRGSVTQTEPLQRWENSVGDALAEVMSDGSLRVGGDLTGPASSAVVEANATISTASGRSLRGWQSLGRITGALADVVTWIVHELEIAGDAQIPNAVSGLHSAVRARVGLSYPGSAVNAELRAGEFEVANASSALAKAVGVYSALTNESAVASIAEAVAFEMAPPINPDTITSLIGLSVPNLGAGANRHAIRTGQGPVHLGDFFEVTLPPGGVPAAGSSVVRVYPKEDGRLYAKDWDNNEYDLTRGGGTTYEHIQSTSSSIWTITHGLGKKPHVTLLDGNGDLVWADISYIDNNSLVITLSQPMTGTAYLN